MFIDTPISSSKSSIRDTFVMLTQIMNEQERRQFVWVLVGMLVVGVVETIGVGSIAPFMAVLSDPEIVEENGLLKWTYVTLGFESVPQLMIFIGSAVLFFLVIGNAASAGVTWLMIRYAWNINHRLSVDLLSSYLGREYLFFSSRNSSDLSSNIIQEVGNVITGILIPIAKALSRVVVGVGILTLLVIVDPVLSMLSGLVLGGLYGLTFILARKKLGEIGERRLIANTNRFRLAGEALQGIKAVKILGAEEQFKKRFESPSYLYSRDSASSQIIATLPRYALETLTFGGVLLLLLVLMVTRDDFAAVIPLVSLYAFAGYKLMPAMQQAYHALARIRIYSPSLILLYKDLQVSSTGSSKLDSGSESAPVTLDKGIELQGLRFAYPDKENAAVADVSLTIGARKTVAFVGATGCGKTTLVDLIMGLLTATSGSISIDGIKLGPHNFRSWQSKIGYVPQSIYLTDSSIASNIAFGVPEKTVNMEKVETAARTANLHEFVSELPAGYETPVGDRGVRFSGGQRQRVGIARALYNNPELLILDEATNALDGVTEDAVMESIRKLSHKKTIILIAHRLTTVKDADIIYLLRDGKIMLGGKYDYLMDQSSEFRSMAGISQ